MSRTTRQRLNAKRTTSRKRIHHSRANHYTQTAQRIKRCLACLIGGGPCLRSLGGVYSPASQLSRYHSHAVHAIANILRSSVVE